jgi:hypothetical protein
MYEFSVLLKSNENGMLLIVNPTVSGEPKTDGGA